MSVELISVLIAMLAVGSGLGWVDPDQQSGDLLPSGRGSLLLYLRG